MIIAAGVLAIHFQPSVAQKVFSGALVIDHFGAFVKALMALAAASTLLLASDHFKGGPDKRFEFAVLALLSTLGFFVMASSNNLMTLYIGLELQSLAAYVLAAFRRDDSKSSEAGLKYFILGALSSGILLYGASLVYGFTGSLAYDQIALNAANGNVGTIFGLVFLICGLAFKMSAAPSILWTPDVYEGAPTPVTALFASAPKGGRRRALDPRALRAVRRAATILAASDHRALGSFARRRHVCGFGADRYQAA